MCIMLAVALAAAMSISAAAVPSDAEVRAVGKYLEELTKGDSRSLRQKKTTKEQYADALAGYAADEKKPAAKFALFREAFKAYVDAKSNEKADGVYSQAQAEGGTEYALAVVGSVTVPAAAKELKARVDADRRCYRQIGLLKRQLKKTPGDETLCEALGLEYAAVGDWNGALAAFLTAPGEVAKVADWELNKGSAYTAAKVAEFWWGYADGKAKPKMEALRLHAAMWYELALGENAYSGNEAKIVQGRIDETKAYGGAAMQEKATLAKQVNELKPIVLPLKGKTVIEFVGVPAGEFMMGTDDERFSKSMEKNAVKPHRVTITRPFWLSKYKVTKELWAAFQKVEISEYDKVMGGMKVPQNVSYMEAMEFCDWLTKKFRNKMPSHYVVRLPTEAEWEYACKAKDSGESNQYYDWGNIKQFSVQAADVRKRAENTKLNLDDKRDWEFMPIEVATKKPNGFGLYDMLGNGFELTLDTFDPNLAKDPYNVFKDGINSGQTALVYGEREIDDPLRFFRIVHNAFGVLRGAAHNNMEPHLYAKRGWRLCDRGTIVQTTTFRLCIGPDLMKEKGYSFKPGKKK